MKNCLKYLGGAALLALPLSSASADHSWADYHWNLSGPNETIEVLTNLRESYWEPLVADAISDWDGSDPDSAGHTDWLNTVIVGTASGSSRKCNPVSGKIVVCSDYYGNRGWLGIATIWTNGPHITEGTTKLNDTYHASGTYSSESWRRVVACQEPGHNVGLSHQNEDFSTDETESCMEYTNQPAGNETPDAHDFEQLDIIYTAHANEGGGGGGDKPCNPRSPKCNSGQDALTFREVGKPHPSSQGIVSSDWGRAVAEDAQGRPNRFEKNLGNGRVKITHITWVPGFRPQARHFGDTH